MELAKIHTSLSIQEVAHPSGTKLTYDMIHTARTLQYGKVTNLALLSTESEKVHRLYLPHGQSMGVNRKVKVKIISDRNSIGFI